LFGLAACSAVEQRGQLADDVANHAGMKKSIIQTDSFGITTYKKIASEGQDLTVYIEGDGFAWAERGRVSANPTPKQPLVLRLAAQDNSPNVIYLARPCQYTAFEINRAACKPDLWTSSRFSEQVINSMEQAINVAVKESDAKKVNLVGYSGGAAVAVIVAARRDDVASLRSVAGNLDTVAVNNYHKVTQMRGSLNPIDYAAKLVNIPQNHFYGSADKIVPDFVSKGFVAKVGNCAHSYKVDNATHEDGWLQNWKGLLAKNLSCTK
jgi:hypothetical protein